MNSFIKNMWRIMALWLCLAATAGAGTLSVAPTGVSGVGATYTQVFADTLVNTASTAQTFTLTATLTTGTDVVKVHALGLGVDNSNFTMVNTSCKNPTAGELIVLNSNALSCSFDVKFTPTVAGWQSGVVNIYSDATSATPTIYLQGNATTTTTTTCTYSLSPTSFSAGAGAAAGNNVNVTTTSGCNWTAASNASWITVTSGASGSGSGSVGYSVAANSGTTSRTGTLTIAGQTFTVTQAGAVAATVPVAATLVSPSGTITTTTPTYTWNAVSNASYYYLWNGTAATWYSAAQAGCSSGTGTCSITGSALALGSYTWYVQTWNSAGFGPWSSGMNFTISTTSTVLTVPTTCTDTAFETNPTANQAFNNGVPIVQGVLTNGIALWGHANNVVMNRGQSYTFVFTTPSTAGWQGMALTEMQTAGINVQKYVTISTQPCDFNYAYLDNPSLGNGAFTGSSYGGYCGQTALMPTVLYTVSNNPALAIGYCMLKPSTTYYANVRNENANAATRGKDSCAAGQTCAFLYQQS